MKVVDELSKALDVLFNLLLYIIHLERCSNPFLAEVRHTNLKMKCLNL